MRLFFLAGHAKVLCMTNDTNDKKPDNEEGKIIDFSQAAKARRLKDAQEKLWQKEYQHKKTSAQNDDTTFTSKIKTLLPGNDGGTPHHPSGTSTDTDNEPMINLPLSIQVMLALMIGIHLLLNYGLPPVTQNWVLVHFSFIPAAWTGHLAAPLWTYPVSLFSFNFLHGSWLHLIMNSVMFLAFGAGVDRMIGAKRMLILFFSASIVAALAHLCVHPDMPYPLIGASGGLSGLFGAILYIYHKRGLMGHGRYGIWPIVAFWVLISVLFGFMGSPDGEGTVAWVAHIGGFIAGMLLVKPVVRLKI
jgi:membrane associated rhomboid family serine protease